MEPTPPDIHLLRKQAWKLVLSPELNGIKVLGTPIGTRAFINNIGTSIISNEMQLLTLLPQLASLQIAWLILYFCAMPRINHLLRTIPPRQVHAIAELHNI